MSIANIGIKITDRLTAGNVSKSENVKSLQFPSTSPVSVEISFNKSQKSDLRKALPYPKMANAKAPNELINPKYDQASLFLACFSFKISILDKIEPSNFGFGSISLIFLNA